jgi:uncharacterized membrane protein
MPAMSITMMTLLATSTGGTFSEVALWGAVLIIVVLIGWMVISAIRRRMNADTGAAVGYTLHDLRRMRESGELSEEEFQRARQAMIEQVKGATSENDAPEGPENAARDGP